VASLHAHNGRLNLTTRFELARKAFAHTAAYDWAISEYLARQDVGAVASTYTLQ
jgi:phosphoribosylaminoimidazolecarboxamide formyltransferase/IMP cyclohydrolase